MSGDPLQAVARDAVARVAGGRLAAGPVRPIPGAASRRAVYAFGPLAGSEAAAGDGCVYAKVYPDDGAAVQLARLRRLREMLARHAPAGPLHVPAPLGADADGRCLVLASATGRLLADLPPGPELRQALGQAGAALAQLHALPADLFGGPLRSGPAAQVHALMRPHPETLAERLPALGVRVRAVLAGIHAALQPPHPLALSHRDVHPRQLFVSAHAVELIDWDLAGAADPALDLANLLLHVERRWPAVEASARAALLHGYGPARVAALHDRLPAWQAFHHLRRACKAERLGHGRAAVARRLLAAESALAESSVSAA